ncbi:MAG: glutathione peroxidase [Fuerstiella sp.]|nr:glutathione peroxidase [Fuerstiella sp.]MCP4787473.1 glutathione peroxidase [Fuerstiella sp.]MCP4859000.1 glutathione peroxidase [Fuerstiella sp.]
MKLFLAMIMTFMCVSGICAVAEETEKKPATSVHDFKIQSLDGKDVDLSIYENKVLLVVNVASECGATPQYTQLQKLHEEYSGRGLVVMGFPCNQFGAQEPGTAGQIQKFCSTNYRVKFPMFAKIQVNGAGQAPLYDFLKTSAEDHSNIGWNFEKFVVGKDGKVVARFKTGTTPDAPEVVRLLEEELGK